MMTAGSGLLPARIRRSWQDVARILGFVLALVILVLCVAGCSANDEEQADESDLTDTVDRLARETERLQAENEALVAQLTEADMMINSQADQLEDAGRATTDVILDADRVCLNKLAHCEERLYVTDEDEEWPPTSPAVWFPPHSGYVTNESTIDVVVFADEFAVVMVGGLKVDSGGRWAGGNAVFISPVDLIDGLNTVDIRAGDEEITVTVMYDADLTRRYGRILDTRAILEPPGSTEAGVEEGCGYEEENACVIYELGVDFGDMDLEPEYGQGDFDAGDVIVEFNRLTPSTVLTSSDFGTSGQLLIGAADIWEYYSYGESSHFDVWSLLLDGITIVQIEGPMPLGD